MKFCQALGWNEPNYFETPAIAHKVKRAVSRLDERLAVSMREMEKADFILVVGADPVNEAPMLALAMRQAFRNGATIVVIDPRPVFLPFEFEHLPVAPDDLGILSQCPHQRSGGPFCRRKDVPGGPSLL